MYRERIFKTIKQRNKNLIKTDIVFLLNNFIWTKVETKLYFTLLVQIKLFNKKKIIFLIRSLFRCLIVIKIRSQLTSKT